MKPSEALRIARKKIFSGEEEYICYALPTKDVGGDIVRMYISLSMSGWQSYNAWLITFHWDFYQLHKYDIRDGRLQWIDWMINEYEKIGQ